MFQQENRRGEIRMRLHMVACSVQVEVYKNVGRDGTILLVYF